MRFARQHPYYGWLFLEPDDYRRIYNQLIQMRDEDLKKGDNSSGFPSGFPDWCETNLRELAKQGNEIIFTTSFGYMEPTLKVAKEFPNIKFEMFACLKFA